MERFKKFVQKLVGSTGLYITPATKKEKVELLIGNLWPYSTDKDLIRLGPNGDGGYLVPDDLNGIAACFSPGVDQKSGFEADCSNLGMQLFLADKSVDKPNLNLAADKFSFIKKFIGSTNNDDFITMADWVNSSDVGPQPDLLLQMDIEGHEYFTLINMPDSLIRQFRIMIIEFHSLHKLWNKEFYNLASTAFNKILQSHTCVHIHPNNRCGLYVQRGVKIPGVAEFTFIRNDRITRKSPRMIFPHSLDFDSSSHAHIALPENWYKSS